MVLRDVERGEHFSFIFIIVSDDELAFLWIPFLERG